jgi:PAS domain S-box-containing protein
MDITERKQLEGTLAKSEEKYRTILEEMKEGYYETDLAGNYTFFNDVICEKLGYSREELMGMNYRIYISPELVKKQSELFHKVYQTGKPIELFSGEQVRKDGKRI